MDKNKLEYEIKKKGMNIAEFCDKIGISRSAFYRKCIGETEFTLSEISTIIDVLGLDSPVCIFFADRVS